MPDPLTLLDAALRGGLLAVLAVLVAILLRERPHSAAARVAIAMNLGLGVQALSAMPWFEASVPRLWQAPLIAISVGNAVLFWVLVQALFHDDFAPRPLHLAAWLGAAVLSLVNFTLLGQDNSVLAEVLRVAQRTVPLACAALAALAAARQWRADLVEGRRRLRIFILITGVVYTLALLAIRVASPNGRVQGISAALDVGALLLMMSVVAYRTLRLGGPDLFTPNPGAAVAATVMATARALRLTIAEHAADPAQERLSAELQQVMDVDRAYRDENLSPALLARRLGVPEYRLRRLINQRLGFRNFNAYVNGMRLDEARAALADHRRRDLPVLRIALDVGFGSIGPFNRAFKAATGLTPTEFRRKNMADS